MIYGFRLFAWRKCMDCNHIFKLTRTEMAAAARPICPKCQCGRLEPYKKDNPPSTKKKRRRKRKKKG